MAFVSTASVVVEIAYSLQTPARWLCRRWARSTSARKGGQRRRLLRLCCTQSLWSGSHPGAGYAATGAASDLQIISAVKVAEVLRPGQTSGRPIWCRCGWRGRCPVPRRLVATEFCYKLIVDCWLLGSSARASLNHNSKLAITRDLDAWLSHRPRLALLISYVLVGCSEVCFWLSMVLA